MLSLQVGEILQCKMSSELLPELIFEFAVSLYAFELTNIWCYFVIYIALYTATLVMIILFIEVNVHCSFLGYIFQHVFG
jgi:hypothetical protein